MSVERSAFGVERSAPRGAVFLSYASQDAEAARRICDALRAAGIEVWFDADGGLEHGDEWDAKIRKQIKECVLFIPIISAHTQARLEGYFRIEWALAAERAIGIADGVPFILPIVVDDTREPEALVPDRFRKVQWTRLPGGVVTPEVKARYLKLWSHRTGAVKHESEVARVTPGLRSLGEEGRPVGSENTGQETRGTVGRRVPFDRAGPAAAWIGAVVVAGAALYFALRLEKNAGAGTRPPALSSSNGLTAGKSAPTSEAQKFVAQGRQVYEGGDEINRENLFLAEELVQRALVLDSAEPDAWELGARLSGMMVWHGIDESAARREKLLQQANRAVALAPDSVAARLVLAEARLNLIGILGPGSAPPSQVAEIERELTALAAREPRNWRIHRALGIACRFTDRTDEALVHLRRAVELSGEHPMATGDLVNAFIRRQRYAEAEPILARALARHRTGRLLAFDLMVKCRWRGDSAGALKAVESWPNWLLKEDRGIAMAWQAAHWGRQPAVALRLVQQFPRDYLRDAHFSGPSAVLTACAHELAGNTAAAQADWQAVVQRCDRDLVTNAQDVVALHWKAWALARLGSLPEAQAAATLLRQRSQSVESSFLRHHTVALLWATVGWNDVALAELQMQVGSPGAGWLLTRAYLQLEPAFDRLRADPRFGELVQRLPAPAPEADDQTTGDRRREGARSEVGGQKSEDGRQTSGAAKPSLDFANAKSIAVLAFENLSGDKDNEYFSDGISEELLNVLAKVPGLRVAARTSAFYFKGKNATAQEIGQKLGVAHLVDGSVRKAGTKVRIVARLSKADTGEQIWSEPYEDELKDVFALQDKIARDIAGKLQLTLALSTQPRRAVKPEAIEAYLLGMQLWARQTPEDGTAAVRHFQRAVEIDPKFPEAYSGLSMAYPFLSLPHDEKLRRTREFAQRAVDLDPLFADGYVARGLHSFFAEWNWLSAEADFRRAIELNPNSRLALESCGSVLAASGRFEGAIALARRGVQLDPLSPLGRYSLVIYLYAGRSAEAVMALEAKRDVYGPTAQLGISYIFAGQVDKAVIELEAAERAAPATEATPALGYAYARAGRRAEALQVLAKWDQTPKNLAVGYWYPRAWIHVGLDDKGKALEDLELGYAQRDTWMVWSKVDPIFAPLRDEPRYQALLKKLELER